jgi:hypothetical protein
MPAGMAGIPVGGMSAGMAGMAQHGMAISWPRGQGHPDPALNYQHVKMCSSYLRFLVTMFGPPIQLIFSFRAAFWTELLAKQDSILELPRLTRGVMHPGNYTSWIPKQGRSLGISISPLATVGHLDLPNCTVRSWQSIISWIPLNVSW